MIKNFDEYQKLGKESIEATVQSLQAATKGLQAIAIESAEYARKSFDESAAAVEKLFGARTLERAIEVQSEFAKTAYESFVAQAAKVGELYADVAKQSYKPIESYASKVSPLA